MRHTEYRGVRSSVVSLFLLSHFPLSLSRPVAGVEERERVSNDTEQPIARNIAKVMGKPLERDA